MADITVLDKMTREEWIAEGTLRFGPDPLQWKFICPACGHVQRVIDFRPYKERGATASDANFNCIGRFAGAKRRAFGDGGPGSGPCDYTSGGLLDLRKLAVVMPDGEWIKSFDFAPEQEASHGA